MTNLNNADWDADEDRPAWETKGRVVYSHGYTEWESDRVYKHRGHYWLSSPEHGFSAGPFQGLAEALARGGATLTEASSSIRYDRREVKLKDLLALLDVAGDGVTGVPINGTYYRLDPDRGWVKGLPPEDQEEPEE